MGKLERVLYDPPSELTKLIQGFHQDFEFDVQRYGGYEEAVAEFPSLWLSRSEYRSAYEVIKYLLGAARPDQLKALFKRSKADYFFGGRDAVRIFKIWHDVLEARVK